jgi:F-type H+-transporting ATPase subunit delta
MSDIRAGHRYATALLNVAAETNSIDGVNADFQSLENLILKSAEFRSFLKSPVVNVEKKKKIVAEIFKGTVSDLTLKFLLFLASKGREGLLPEIIRQYYRLRNERLGILDVKTATAVPMTKAQEQDLIAQLEKVTKKKIRIHTVIDPSLKGGFTVQHEDTVWDASVRHQLDLLREKFLQGSA